MPPMRIKEHARAKKGTFKRLVKSLFAKFKWQLIFVLACMIFTVIGNVSSSFFIGLVTAAVTKAVETPGINPFVDIFDFVTQFGFSISSNITILLIIMGSIYLVGIFSIWLQNRTLAIIGQKYLNEFRIALFNKMQDLPIRYFDTHARGDIMSIYTNDIDTIRQLITQAIPTIITCGLAVFFLLIVMLFESVWLLLVVVGCTIIMLLATVRLSKKSSKYFIKQQKQIGILEGNIEESIKGLKVIKVFSHEEKSTQEFTDMDATLREYSTEANTRANITGPINANIGNFMYVLCAVVGFMLLANLFPNVSIAGVQDNLELEAVVSLVVTFLSMSRMFTNNVNNLSQNITFIVMGMAGASRCFDLMDEEIEKDEGYVTLVNYVRDENGNIVETDKHTRDFAWKHPHKADGSVTYTELKGDIELVDVDFGYVADKTVLHNVSIYAHPGQKIAFVGATGAGKTTITNLLNRFYDIQDGKIRYDGININKIKKADLRKSLGIVLQDTNLFSGAVMENIRYGRLDATDEEVYEAAKIANAYDFITRLPQGFNTMLTGDGSNLSQGQRQLLSIARAAVADAPVMILDEATSSIDTRTEQLVQKGTDQLMEGRTVFVIAHRLSTVQNSDCIMVLDHGHIIERGSHEELIAKKGTYYQLYTGAFELE